MSGRKESRGSMKPGKTKAPSVFALCHLQGHLKATFWPPCVYVCVCVHACTCMCVCMLSRVQLFATPWAIAHQAPLSMEFSGQEY